MQLLRQLRFTASPVEAGSILRPYPACPPTTTATEPFGTDTSADARPYPAREPRDDHLDPLANLHHHGQLRAQVTAK